MVGRGSAGRFIGVLILLPPSEGKSSPSGKSRLDLDSLVFADRLGTRRAELIAALEKLASGPQKKAIEALSGILAGELPKRRAVLESRLRRIEEFAEEPSTREAATRLRRNLGGPPASRRDVITLAMQSRDQPPSPELRAALHAIADTVHEQTSLAELGRGVLESAPRYNEENGSGSRVEEELAWMAEILMCLRKGSTPVRKRLEVLSRRRTRTSSMKSARPPA